MEKGKIRNALPQTERLEESTGERRMFLLEEPVICPAPQFVMGVDTYDSNRLAYCLTKHTGEFVEVVLAKTSSNRTSFNQEVENLCKYFDAKLM